MKYLIPISFFLISCSGGDSSKSFSGVKLSPVEQKAQRLIGDEAKVLNTRQYAIHDEDLALLSREGLISEEEKKSLKIIK